MLPNRRAWCLVAALARVGASLAGAPPEPPPPWTDPSFQKSFLGTYGVRSELEPQVTPEDTAILEEIYPIIPADPAEAARRLEAAMRPDSSATLDFILGNLRLQQGRVEEARRSYELALAKFPGFHRAYRNLGLVRVQLGDPEGAIQAFTRMIQIGGADAVVYGLLGYAHSTRRDFVAAESAYRSALLLEPENSEWRLGLVRCLIRQQRYAEASSLLDNLVAGQPERAELWLLQADALIGMKQAMRAAENLEIIARMGKANADTLYLLGDLYLSEGQADPAASAYRRAIELEAPRGIERAARAVERLSQRGALRQASSLLERLEDLAGGDLADAERRSLLKLRARIAVAEGAGGEALSALQETVALDPLDGEALLLLGQHYARSGEPDRAVFYFERAASLEAYEGEAKTRQAQVLVSQGRYDEALPLLKRAQEIRPRDDLARYLEQVERLARSRR